MPAAVRSYRAAGVALVGAGVIVAAQIVPPLNDDESRVVRAAISLAAAVVEAQPCTGYLTDGCDIWATPSYAPVALDQNGSAANIPANLFNAVISIPRAFVDAINDLSYALEVTGNWWVYTPTNVLGFDPADPPKATALANLAIPFKPLSNSVGDHFSWWARANLPMNAGCTGSVGPACADPAAILGQMFQAPSWVLNAGYQFPELNNPISDAEAEIGEEIPGSVGQPVPWSGSYVKLDPADTVNSVLNYLLADPATNTPKALTLAEIGATLERFGKALVLAFNPFVPRSFLLKGWPYTALTPLFLPFVPTLCPTCDPENPGGPPRQLQQAAATAILASAEAADPDLPSTSLDAAAVAVANPAVPTMADDAAVDSADRTVPKPATADRTIPSTPAELDPTADVPAEDVAGATLAAEFDTAADKPAAEPAAKQRRGQDSSADRLRGHSARAAADAGEQAGG
jgi:hypothetical protein